MIHKEIKGNELYVWMNGALLYKRWLNLEYGRVFSGIWGSFTTREVDGIKLNLNGR